MVRATLEALSKSHAIIEFNLDGTIITSNPVMGAGGVPVKIVKIVKFATDVTEAVARREVVIVLGRELEKLASGDLTLNIETKFRGEQDEVRHSFNATVEKTAVLPWTCGMSFDECKWP